MKNCVLAFIFLLLSFPSCRRRPAMPEQSIWVGTVDLGDGKLLPFRMNLDFSAAQPSGYFLVGDEKTPIPEITRNGNSSVTSTRTKYCSLAKPAVPPPRWL